MYTRSVLVLVAAAVTLANSAASDRPPEATAASTGVTCPDSLPKLCTDDAVIKGTTTHLTYFCPETKTVEVTETVFITVHDGESKLSVASTYAPGDNDKMTTLTATSKSTLFITKTIKSKHSTSPLPGEPATPVSPFPVSSSTESITSDNDLVETTQGYPGPTTMTRVTAKSTTTILETISIPSHFSASHPGLSWSLILGPSISSVGSLLTNPLRPSPTSSGLWLNITSSDAVAAPSPSVTSVVQLSSSLWNFFTSTLPTPAVTSNQVIAPTEGIKTSSTINSILTLANSSTTPSVPGYSFPLVSSSPAPLVVVPNPSVSGSSTEFTQTVDGDPLDVKPNPTPHPGLPPVAHSGPSNQFSKAASTGFISLPSDTEIYSSIASNPTPTDVEVFPTIKPDATTDIEDFPTMIPDNSTSAVSILTDGTFISSAMLPYPTVALTKRHNSTNETNVDGAISKVYTTTTITVQDANSSTTTTKTHSDTPIGDAGSGAATEAYPGATTQPLGKSGTGNVRPNPMSIVIVLFFLPLAVLVQ